MLHRTITRWINVRSCIPTEFNSPVQFNQLHQRNGTSKHDKRSVTNHVYTHYCDVIPDTFNITPLLFNCGVVVAHVEYEHDYEYSRQTSEYTMSRDIGWQTWSTWLIFSRVLLLFSSTLERTFYLASRTVVSRRFSRRLVTYTFAITNSVLNIRPHINRKWDLELWPYVIDKCKADNRIIFRSTINLRLSV